MNKASPQMLRWFGRWMVFPIQRLVQHLLALQIQSRDYRLETTPYPFWEPIQMD